MPVIQELSPHMANLIAAGEVVERPASVVKELIENAIDAGAGRIVVEIQNGGISYLRITDNGCGMAKEDAAIAFRRHATSKLRREEDLAAIGTLGFRGEALAAISSVSHIDLFTKQADTLAGAHLHLDAGAVTEQEEAGCPDGTSMIIRDLFYNTPARMKFLKKDFTEAGYVLSVVQHAALSHPEIAFSLIRDGKQVFSTSGDGQLKTPVFQVFGKDMFANLLEVPVCEREQFSAWGYITKPHFARPNRSMQHFFVNGRYVKSRLMQAALEEAYRNAMITGKYPSGAVFLQLPYSMVDVNVHPAKTEVKFALEKPVFEVIYIACKNALEAGDNIPVLQQKGRAAEDHVTKEQQVLAPPEKAPPLEQLIAAGAEKRAAFEPAPRFQPPAETMKRSFLPYIECDEEEDTGFELCASTPDYIPRTLPEPEPPVPSPQTGAAGDAETHMPEPEPAPPVPERTHAFQGGARVLGECFHTYIVAEEGDDILMIDKHAAHERMIFNRLRATTEPPSQTLVAPVVAELPPPLDAVLLEGLAQVRSLGFDLEPFGDGSFAVRAVPAYLDAEDVPSVLTEIAEKLNDHRSPVPDRLDDLIHTVSCKAAVKAGSHTGLQELQGFCDRVLADSEVRSCPHGRPTVVRLTKYEIDKLFKRVNQ